MGISKERSGIAIGSTKLCILIHLDGTRWVCFDKKQYVNSNR